MKMMIKGSIMKRIIDLGKRIVNKLFLEIEKSKTNYISYILDTYTKHLSSEMKDQIEVVHPKSIDDKIVEKNKEYRKSIQEQMLKDREDFYAYASEPEWKRERKNQSAK